LRDWLFVFQGAGDGLGAATGRRRGSRILRRSGWRAAGAAEARRASGTNEQASAGRADESRSTAACTKG